MAGTETVVLEEASAVSRSLAGRFQSIRAMTSALAGRLMPEDQMVQSCPEASPVKWHLAHSTWFFETFVLREFVPGYQPFDKNFFWLFNSYYKSLGEHPEKRLRASFSRPLLEQVRAYRKYVEQGVLQLLETNASDAVRERIELGMHHEQQHQELIVTDIKHAFWSNPLQPAYLPAPLSRTTGSTASKRPRWFSYPGGLVETGHDGEGFSFDNEMSRHRIFQVPFRIASSLVTCADYLAFMRDDGYRRPELWLSDGWDTIQAEDWRAPLYWRENPDGKWEVFTLHGSIPLEELAMTPVCHVSYYEADAYARWAGARLLTEAEWEQVADSISIAGNFLEGDVLHPRMVDENGMANQPAQLFGDVWEWTQSPYIAYPGYRPADGALGEYNGKFMCNQLVLRGGSVATPRSHIRATYRNFFAPATRWQFSGIRLAADGEPA